MDVFPDYSEFASFRTELPMPDRLMLWQKMLEERFGKGALLSPGNVVLRVVYREPDAVLVGRATGNVEVENEGDDPAALSDDTPEGRARLDAARATCANNLKQLGLVIKMFENECEGEYTPPGWLTVYPEYLTDTSILTSPKDAPGTDSYVYLFPAVNIDRMAFERVSDYENPAARAKFQSEMPLVINRTDFPGSTPGRNVLFADGHVEYIRSPEWRERLANWLSESDEAGDL